MSEQQFAGENSVSAGRASARRMFSSEDIFQGHREIIIEHQGQHYRLQITKAGKLILNK